MGASLRIATAPLVTTFYTAYGTGPGCDQSTRFGFMASDGTCVYMNLGRATLVP